VITKRFMDEIERHVEQEREKEGSNRYWAKCPSCGRRVIRQALIEKGCYICGWRGQEDDVELAEIKRLAGHLKTTDETDSYWISCPNCGAKVVKEQFIEDGCYLCGYKLREIPMENPQIQRDRKKDS
jgi:ssDNA-binding Zn-finger/Zn-ribbon topoisomerase 1